MRTIEPGLNLLFRARISFEGADTISDSLVVDYGYGCGVHQGRRTDGECHAWLSYQRRERRTMRTTESMTGTSTSTPTTVASAAPDWKPNRTIAVATASSK